MVITATSRCATWESSWARTASTSGSSSRRSRPVVAQTTAALGLRPVAKALGMSTSAIATRGLGMSASAHSRSMIPCSSGASAGVTSRPCIDHSAMRSENQYWANRSRATITTMADRHPDPPQDGDERAVQDDQQEPGDEHPEGQAPVGGDVAGTWHSVFLPWVRHRVGGRLALPTGDAVPHDLCVLSLVLAPLVEGRGRP